jgi:parvulin-like peptidyl-prolyl isomerase
LKDGADFSELARALSQGPGASNGGDLGFFNVSQLDKELQEVVTKVPEGGISEPIPRAGGLQIIKVTQKEKGGTRNLQEVRDGIFNRLYKEEVNRRYTAWLSELRKKAYTKIIF